MCICACVCLRGCSCCLEGRANLWLQQTHCNCIPSYMTAVFPYRRMHVFVCVCVCDRQHIMFTCTHCESLARQGSKQTAIIKKHAVDPSLCLISGSQQRRVNIYH